jgi:hypothetical protein
MEGVMEKTSFWDRALASYEKDGQVPTEFFADVRVGSDPDLFVADLERILDGTLSEGVQKLIGPGSWDTVGKQINACYFNAWGEIRSATTFARQIEKIGFRYPSFKLGVARQLHDEMRHFYLYRDCAIAMGGEDVLKTDSDKIAHSLMEMFDFVDTFSDDPRERAFVCQFVNERYVIFLFRDSMLRYGLHPEFRKTLEAVIPDEYFHVSNGRTAARLLAHEGPRRQGQMLELTAQTISQPIADIIESGAIGKGLVQA